MTPQEIQERNKQIALMLGAEIQNKLKRIYIDKMIDNEFTFHNMSVDLNTYEWNGTTNIHYIPFDMLQFHSDWNWVMEAVQFIRRLGWNYDISSPIASLKESSLFECDFWHKNNYDIKGRSLNSQKEAVFIGI